MTTTRKNLGSTVEPQVINREKDHVGVRSNIRHVPDGGTTYAPDDIDEQNPIVCDYWLYDETRYTPEEYMTIEMADLITDLQVQILTQGVA